jgi:uncharacterized membrane protein YhaH (DUF805 family)
MDSQFTAIIQRLAAERGKETLFRVAQCKSLLADYTRGEYNKESRVFLQAVDAGIPKILAETTELESCKDRMVQRLQDDYFLSREAAWDVVALLALVLRNDTSGIPDAAALAPDKKTGGVSRYYLSVNYRTTGPFEPDAVKVMIERGLVTEDSYLRMGEDSAWEPIGSLPEFKALLDAQSAAVQSAPASSSGFCSKCGAQSPEGYLFCVKCGERLVNPAPKPNEQSSKKNLWQYFTGAFGKYAVFRGRARRAEYWSFVLFFSIVLAICGSVDEQFYLFFTPDVGILSALFTLASFLPAWSVMVRRFHDVDKSAWFCLIPIYGFILLCIEGTRGVNRFGEDPKGA